MNDRLRRQFKNAAVVFVADREIHPRCVFRLAKQFLGFGDGGAFFENSTECEHHWIAVAAGNRLPQR